MARTSIQNANASLYFNGATTSINLGTPSSLINIGDFTFSCWVNNTKQKSTLWGNTYIGGATGQGILLGSSTVGIYGKITLFQGTVSLSDQSNNAVGNWSLITVVQVGSLVYIYRNGVVLVNGSALTKVGPTAATSSYLGSTNGASDFLKGNLSNVGIWDRGLTATEITALYNGSAPTSGLLAYYPLNEGAGTIAYDTSGNGNNGTITSGTWTRDAPSKTRTGVNGNLVYNGNFEIAPVVNVATTTGGKLVDGTATGTSSVQDSIFGWYIWNYTTSYAAMFDTSVKYSGTASIKISTTATASSIGLRVSIHNDPSFKKNNIPVLPSTSYTYSGWVKTNVVSGSATTGARLQFVTSTGANDVTTTTAVTGLVATQDWTQYTGTFTTAATARFVTPVLQIIGNDGTGTLIMDAWFDDITLTPTTATTRTATTGPYRNTVENLVANGDFEYAPAFTAATNTASRWIDGTATGSASDFQYGWALFSAGVSFSTQFDNSIKYNGQNSLKASIAATGSNIEVMNSPSISSADVRKYAIPALPSTSYTLTYKMKTNLVSGSATTGAKITANERNAAGTQVVSNSGSTVLTTTDWTSYTVSFTTNSATRFITLKCVVTGSDGAGTLIMDAWFDDIVLTKTTPDARTIA